MAPMLTGVGAPKISAVLSSVLGKVEHEVSVAVRHVDRKIRNDVSKRWVVHLIDIRERNKLCIIL